MNKPNTNRYVVPNFSPKLKLSFTISTRKSRKLFLLCYLKPFSVFVVFLPICNFLLFSSPKGSKRIKILTSHAWNYLLISLLIISLRIPKHKIIPFTSVRKNIWVLDYSCMRNILTVWILIYTDLLLRSVNQVGVLMLTNKMLITYIIVQNLLLIVQGCPSWWLVHA